MVAVVVVVVVDEELLGGDIVVVDVVLELVEVVLDVKVVDILVLEGAGSFPAFSNSMCLVPAKINTEAKGSNTHTINIINHCTARSRLLCSVSPVKNAEIYFIGPTSASTFRTSAAIGARSSLSCAIFFCSVSLSLPGKGVSLYLK